MSTDGCEFCNTKDHKIVGRSIRIPDMASHAGHRIRVVPFGDDESFLAGIGVECVECRIRLAEITNKVKFCPMCGASLEELNSNHLYGCACFICKLPVKTCPHCMVTRRDSEIIRKSDFKGRFCICKICKKSFDDNGLYECINCGDGITKLWATRNSNRCTKCK